MPIRFEGGGGSRKPPQNWTFLQAYTSNGTFTSTENQWYRVFCIGKSGDGGKSYDDSSNKTSYEGCPAGAGGNSGGISVSALYIKKGESISVTITDSISSFGNYLSAESGAIGGDATRQSAGASNTKLSNSYGGNIINATGKVGMNGENRGEAYNGGNGGNGALYYMSTPLDRYSATQAEINTVNACKGGTKGGADLYRKGTDGGSYIIWSAPNIKITGAGGGGGGGGPRALGSLGGTGMPGVVIIEKGVK